MSVFTAKMLKEARIAAHFSQEDVAKILGITDRKLRSIEANEHPLMVDDLLKLADLYKVDVRELLFDEYVKVGEEQILCNRYASFLRVFDQLTDREKEDVIWVIKHRNK